MSNVTKETGSVEIPGFQNVPNVCTFKHDYYGNEDQIWRIDFHFIPITKKLIYTKNHRVLYRRRRGSPSDRKSYQKSPYQS